ncbi:probable LRR receptor-like serine/threonine-protein kinase At3g47570 [Punica granatum]|uniref:non-specific serine/threonine protein kinase n=1 Tax=Punica granatum TaxID=22663 RepID=A0A6P8C6K3_PUNGR|nr:probable LRR receptor-like serine/threonine-protein kinase At3g47570 [Punica granatum]
MSYHSLLKATNGFSEAYFIGVGAFCSVYKGIISEGDGEVVVAVKVLNMFKQGAASSFLAECQALRNIRHRNLVKVITACSSGDGNGNDFKALVYEYMPSGSLEYWLQPALEGNQARVMKRNLSLVRRLNIAINVASALDYLHHQCETPIVHCDLKPSNILLDEEMVAHVGDFGLARFVTEGPIPTSSIGIRSSTGYVPPEYGMGSEASTLGDVYSYGILLLELFTGKRPTDEMFDESMNLHSFAKIAMVGRVKDIMDPVLVEEVSSPTYHQKTAKAWACLALIFQIGLACSAKVPRERMRIGLVVTKLASIRNKLLETDKGECS